MMSVGISIYKRTGNLTESERGRTRNGTWADHRSFDVPLHDNNQQYVPALPPPVLCNVGEVTMVCAWSPLRRPAVASLWSDHAVTKPSNGSKPPFLMFDAVLYC